jgi:biopolymer transport protein ExbB/TolQ
MIESIGIAGVGQQLWASASNGLLAIAQEAAAAEGGPSDDSTVLSYLEDGGSVMYVILAISIVAGLVFLIRAVDLYLFKRLNVKLFVNTVVGHVEARRFKAALDYCQGKRSHPAVFAVRAGLLKANRRDAEIERAIENQLITTLPPVTKGIALMGLLANISTLLGLLGTIGGLIQAFTSVAAASAVERQNALASGISVAMYTTAFGLVVAVPLLFAHHILSRRAEKITADAEAGASAVFVALTSIPREDRDSAVAESSAPSA